MQAFTSWLFAFVTPYMYNVGEGSGNLGAKTAFVYAGSSVLLFCMAWFLVPETRGLGTGELDMLYERRVSPRKFKGRAMLPVQMDVLGTGSKTETEWSEKASSD